MEVDQGGAGISGRLTCRGFAGVLGISKKVNPGEVEEMQTLTSFVMQIGTYFVCFVVFLELNFFGVYVIFYVISLMCDHKFLSFTHTHVSHVRQEADQQNMFARGKYFIV